MTRLTDFPHPQWQRRIAFAALVSVLACAPAWAQKAGGKSGGKKRVEEKELPAVIQADAMTGRPDREVTVERNVEITRGGTTITGDKATYRVVEDQVEASGNICMKRFGDRYYGDEVKLRIDEMTGYVTNPRYWLERNNANGHARRIDFEGEDQATVIEGTYSTCEGPDPDWYLKSDTLHLDHGRDVGTAGKTIVYFKDVPILGTPAISFPLSDARKSGVLPPAIGTTNKGGLEISVPYYFNIAPNRDLTLYPNLIAQRGLQLGAQGRYLGRTFSGETRAEFMSNDRQTGTDRYAITSTHVQTLSPGLIWAWNASAASDDDYPSDFPRTITTSSQRLLLRDMSLNYFSTYWNAAVRTTTFQVLQDPAAPIVRPYSRLPQLNFNAGRQDLRGFDVGVDSELTRFWHPDFVRGDRMVVTPHVAFPMIRPGYFVTPKLAFDYTQYRLDNHAPGTPSDPSRSLPVFSVDSGLVFERPASFFGTPMTQTLEPRLFYVRTPYRDQSNLPLFDTALADLSFAQLFSENRFVGHDRINDANQWTAAVVSRYIDDDGAEGLRMAIGQRFYASKQQVNLGAAGAGAGGNETRSDLLISASGAVSKALNLETNFQFSDSLRELNRANAGIRWQPAEKKVMNLFYRRDLFNKLEQLDASAQWPLAKRWYGVGRLNYSLNDRKIVEGLVGTEYKADCWVFRIVAQRIPTAAQKATSAIFFQLELNGLARLGSNPLDALKRSIPGYQQINQH